MCAKILALRQIAPEDRLTPKQLEGYRQWLAELEEEARAAPAGLNRCDAEVWQYFRPDRPTGSQVYHSFYNEELLDILIGTMNRAKRSPHFGKVYTVYRCYLELRFHGMGNAKSQARLHIKQKKAERAWPADWPQRVSVEPLLSAMERRGTPLNPADREMLCKLCDAARETGLPPTVDRAVQSRLDRLCGCGNALRLMGIPTLGERSLRHMQAFWSSQRGGTAVDMGWESPQKSQKGEWQ